MAGLLSKDSIYREWLSDLKKRIRQSQAKAAVQINTALLELYWSIGADIVQKQSEDGWGSAVIPQLSRDLRHEFPDARGFSERNLRDMKRFYLFYSELNEIRQQPVAELGDGVKGKQEQRGEYPHSAYSTQSPSILVAIPWRHHLEIIARTHSTDEALFYIHKTIEGGWSRATLVNNLTSDLYQRQGKSPNNFTRLLPAPQSELVAETLKDPYNFEFITLTEEIPVDYQSSLPSIEEIESGLDVVDAE